jgi:hypothetical protein
VTFVTIRTEESMQDVTVARLQSSRIQTPLSLSFKCNVLRESLSVDSQNMDFRMDLMSSFSDPLKIVFA